MSFKIEHRVGVAAPAAAVWDILEDFASWGEWNPVHPEIAGRKGMGATLQVAERIGEEPAKTLTAVMPDWEPGAQLLWNVARGPMARSMRYLEIEALSDTGCIFANGELWEGLLGQRLGKAQRRVRFAAFREMGEALKARAEAVSPADSSPGR